MHSIRSEFDIKQSLERVQGECFRQFHDFLALISAQGLIVELNHYAETITGCRTGDRLNYDFSSAPWWFSEIDRRACAEAELGAIKGNPIAVKLRLRSVLGQIMSFEIFFQPLIDSRKMIIGILAHGRPATVEDLPFGRI